MSGESATQTNKSNRRTVIRRFDWVQTEDRPEKLVNAPHRRGSLKSGTNPLLDKFLSVYEPEPTPRTTSLAVLDRDTEAWIESAMKQYQARDLAVHEYAWAVPDEEALTKIASYGPIIEVFAGKGYWARLLEDRGVDVIATDIGPERGKYTLFHTFTDVYEMEARQAAVRYANRMLLMVWPPNQFHSSDPTTGKAARAYLRNGGKRIIYIGEPEGGCTADDEFFRVVGRMTVAHEQYIPKWHGLHDYMTVYER